ncbi:DUF1127 domain-containing protein [Pseudomonas fontis]|uniref:DUF1127 domain-containing protein n=1 Tax=Pseudomonas fontis TaxID=2942633 RepID=A0ABT5NLL7_9PSED|nr:DUF1127 domain-containing protein [Pseudomonas fontis]MDD0975441.1 DUF1127 domain-containing protein [Pseudomonas fontis]MDD0989196.1 DUF1127 domain-containing protein [Pseudomonas fontis]
MKGQISSILHFKHQHRDLSVHHVLADLVNTFARWRQLRLQRRELASMSDAALKDIGLSRADILMEIERPFWDDPLKK